MGKHATFSITLIVLMALPIVASLSATQKMPLVSSLNLSTQPMHRGHPRIPVPPVTPNVATTVQQPCPLPSGQCWASFNWGGYAVTGDTGSVSDVKGSWVVPSIQTVSGQCSQRDLSWYDSSFWIGIDGWNSNTVEQTGTSSDCYYGALQYYAWYEFYPAASVTLFTVKPGDRIIAEVSYSSQSLQFTTAIKDLTSGKVFKTSAPVSAVPGAMENSAEWISESAAACIDTSCTLLSLLDLSDFGTGTFSFATATVNAVTGPISSFGSNVQWTEMVNMNFPATPGIKAVPGPLTKAGNSFNVKFVSAGP